MPDLLNDHDDIATLVFDYWYVLPRPLKRRLAEGTRRSVRELLQ